MKLKLSVKDLLHHGACDEGIEAFRRVFGAETVELDWSRETQLEFLRGELRRYFGWAVAKGIIPMWSMYGANLRGADLCGADLRDANLYGADLSGAIGFTPAKSKEDKT